MAPSMFVVALLCGVLPDIGYSDKDMECLPTSCAPKWDIYKEEMETVEVRRVRGDFVMLPCMATGTPTPVVSWKKDGSMVHTNESQIIIVDEFGIFLPHITEVDGGWYTCNVSNIHGNLQRKFQLHVIREGSNPIWHETSSPSNVTVTDGGTAIFTCNFTSDLHTLGGTVRWVRVLDTPCLSCHGNKLQLKEDVNTGVNRLRLPGVGIVDAGQYMCILESSNGTTVEHTAWLTVLPLAEKSEPKISGVRSAQDRPSAGPGMNMFFQGVGVSLAVVVGLAVLGMTIVGGSMIYKSVCRREQELPYRKYANQ